MPFPAAVWTVNLGYGNETLVKAVSDQLMQLCYFANGFGNIPTIQFSKKLIEKMPGMSRVYLSNSGSEANEKAFKIVRQISQLKHGGKKYKIVYRNRDYHGTTITTLSACGQEERKNQYGPFTPGFVEFPACSAYRSPYPRLAPRTWAKSSPATLKPWSRKKIRIPWAR